MLARNTILQSRYRIVRPLGRGGMGQVYEAIDDTVDSIVAIKETFANTDRLRSAFEHEAKLLANLKHPVLPRVMHHFLQGDRQFLVMEFVEGLNLAQLLELRGLPFRYETLIPWTDKLLDALAYLHRQREPIIHRDIKPANIKVTNEGEIYLLDFGLAKGASGQETSSVHGYTAAYAPLEQLNNAGTSAQSDLYALGATLYHLLTGNLPVSASKRDEIIEERNHDPLIPLHQSNPNVPEALSAIISQAMAMRRKDRFASASTMKEELRAATLTIGRELEQAILDTPTKPMEQSNVVLNPTEPAVDPSRRWIGQVQDPAPKDVYLETMPSPLPIVPPLPSDSTQRSWPSQIDSESSPVGPHDRERIEEEERRQTVEGAERPAIIEEEKRREEELGVQKAEAKRKRAEEQARQETEEEARRQTAQRKRDAEEAERQRATEEQKRGQEKERKVREADERLQHEAEVKAEAWRKEIDQQAECKAEKLARGQTDNDVEFKDAERQRAAPAKRATSWRNRKRVIVGVACLVLVIGVIVVWRFASHRLRTPVPPPGMAYVPGGDFMVGRDGPDPYERPPHKVTVKPFFIDVYDVTQAEYKKCVDEAKCSAPRGWTNGVYPDGTARQPVTGVTWDAANDFAKWAGKRLPTEEEWEFAARGNDGRRYPWGNDWKQGLANANGASDGLADVGAYKGESPYGEFDMAGNAWQWTASKMIAYPGGTLPMEVSDDLKVIRGGTFQSNSNQVTTTYRRGYPTTGDEDYSIMTFRCVKDLP